MACALAVAAPASVLGHEPSIDTIAGHIAEDSVTHSPALERKLTRRTAAATTPDIRAAAAAVVGNEHDVGSWGPLVNWPVVAINAALLPNGKVLAYDSVGDGATESFPDQTFTRATVWDPNTGTQTDVRFNLGYNIFCSGFAHLMDGSLFIAGGNKDQQLNGIVNTTYFNPDTNQWSQGPDMTQGGRWYPTVTALNNGEQLITSGGPSIPEVRQNDNTLRSLSNASLSLPLYPWFDVAPNGRAFYSGPDQTMRALDTSGAGAWQTFGQRDPIDRSYGGHAFFDVGKILVAGGGSSSADARVVNINGATPQVTPTAPMANGRRQHNLTVLADGTVLATGGNSSGATLVDLNNGVYAAELWNPATGTWKTLASEQATRQYHSTALLLPDGRVLSAGGGICDECDRVGYLNKNGQVFSPPYLYNPDGSLAPRPGIAGAPATIQHAANFQIDTPDAAAIRKVALVRLGAVTHSDNMEQRYVPLSFTAGTGALTATAPANASTAPPGVYMLFIIDANGVPSVAKMVTVGGADPPPPPADTAPPTVPTGLSATAASSTQVNLGWTASTDNVGVSGYRVERCAGSGCSNFVQVGAPSTTSYSDTGLSPSTTYRYQVRAADAAGNLSAYSAVVVATTGAAPPTPSGLVGAWAFSEGVGGTTADASGNGNAATLQNGPIWTGGKYGGGLRFDGINDFLAVANSPSLNLSGTAMTLSMWINPVAGGGDQVPFAKFWSGTMSSPYYQYGLELDGGLTPHFYLGSAGGLTGAAMGSPLAPGQWSHLAIVFNGTSARFYVNGNLVSSPPLAASITARNSLLYMAADLAPGQFFNGSLDDVRVYNRAENPAEIQTDMNNPVTQAAADTAPPTAPTGLTATAASSTQVNLAWTASTDNVGVSGYRVERCAGSGCSNFVQVGTPSTTSYSDTGLSPSTIYRYQVRAVDAAANLGPYSPIATATTQAADTTPPTAPTGLTATAASSTQVNLAWTASTDNVGVTGYRVERCQGQGCTNFAEVAAPTTTTYSDTGRSPSTIYRYQVRATDLAGNLSSYSAIATATTSAASDTSPPSAPTGLTATAISTTRIDLTWAASTDDVGVSGYRVERCQGTNCTNFAQVGTATTTDFSSTGLLANTNYRFRVRAVDAAGNLSPYSGIVTRRTLAPDTTRPTAPTALAATPASPTQINLVWTASTDNVGVTGYRVERCQGTNCTNFAQIGTTTTTDFSSTGLQANSTYRFRVRAVDAAGNLSTYSSIAGATTPPVLGPSPPTITSTSPASPANDNDPEVIGTVGAGSPSQVKIYRNATCSGAADVTGTVAQFTGAGITVNVAGDATTALSARASDALNTDSACSNTINYIEDSTAPAAPQITDTDPDSPANDNSPEVKGSAETGSTVRLHESPSCGGAIEAQGTAASFASPGLTAAVANDATATFTATATDQAGNVSGCSAPFAYTEVSSDATPPTASVTAPAAGSVVSGNVTVSANASDNVGVAGVQFLLDGAGLGAEDTSAPYSITWDTTTASNGVHVLQARARDTAGNLGTSSSSVTVTVSNSAPPTPAGLVAGWAFNENFGTTVNDVSGNGNTATLQNGPTWTSGKYGSGLQFDGVNDYLSVPNSSSLDISGSALSMSMWINPGSISGDSVVLGKFWNAGMTSPYYQYGLELSNGKPVFCIGTGVGLQAAGMDTALALNQWSHLAIVFNGSQAQFYVNGALVSSKSLNVNLTARGQQLRMGADADTWQFYKGVLDNMRIYNRTLSPSEVQSDMNTGL